MRIISSTTAAFARHLSLLFLGTVLALPISAQDEVFPSGERGYQEQYQRNIKKSRINGVYIPKNIEEAIAELDALSPPDAVAKFANAPEEVIASKLHFGLGRWISVNWNFAEGSRYVEYLRNLGITDPDHMIQFTIVSFHRAKGGRDIDIEGQVAKYQALRQEYLEEQARRQTTINETTRKIDPSTVPPKKKD